MPGDYRERVPESDVTTKSSSALGLVLRSPLYRRAAASLFFAGLGISVAMPQLSLFLVQDLNASLPVAGTAAKTLAANPDAQTLAVLDGTSDAVLWDVKNPARPVRKAVVSDATGITAVTLSPDGHTVATSNRD